MEQTLQQTRAEDPSLGQPPVESVGDRIMGNLADSKLGKFLGGMKTVDLDPSGFVVPDTSEPVFEGLATRTGDFTPPVQTIQPAADIATSTPAPLATPDVNAGLGPVALGAPTSGSGIGTSVVNDVNFLQEGLKQAQAAPAPQTPSFSEQGLTTAGGQPLSEFLAGGTPLGGRGDSGAAGEQAMQDAGVLAGTRAGADGTFAEPRAGTARGPEGRDVTEGQLTLAEAKKLTGGDTDAARAMQERQRQGLGEFAKKEAKVDDRTPEKIASDRLALEAQVKQNEILDQRIEAGKTPDATPEAKKAGARAQGVKDGTITQAQADEATKTDLIGKPPMGYATWAEYESDTGTDADGDGKVATEADAEAAAPEGGAIPVVNTQAEYDALPSGAKYIDSEGNQATKK